LGTGFGTEFGRKYRYDSVISFAQIALSGASLHLLA